VSRIPEIEKIKPLFSAVKVALNFRGLSGWLSQLSFAVILQVKDVRRVKWNYFVVPI
jgi:hypothetical protein